MTSVPGQATFESDPATGAPAASGLPRRAVTAVRAHWLFAIVFTAGLVLRVLAEIAYRPAIFYIDTMKYLYNSFPGADPVGYEVPLRAILAVGNLEVVTAVQHLLGLAMAITIYLLLIRRGTWRWLAALAAAPILLDAYQVQIEQTIMPDVWFEALILAGIAVLLTVRPGGRLVPALRAVIIAGLLLGLSATVRQIGEILLLPGLLYLVARGGGWRAMLVRSAGFTAAFAVPVIGYMAGSGLLTGHYWLASATPQLSTYGRMASAADCATLRIPAYERALCPTARQRAYGIDWLDHDRASPLKTFVAPAGMNRFAVIASFNQQVATQQPGRVIAAVARDAADLFALTRTSSQGGTPISRWQFQRGFAVYPGWVRVTPTGTIVLSVYPQASGGTLVRQRLTPSYGGTAQVVTPLAAFLRSYQLGGGYTPGPLMALFALAGLVGSVLALIWPIRPDARRIATDCLAFFGSGAILLLASDAFQFSWRYQLPALITLPPAGALAIAALVRLRGARPAAQAGDDAGDDLAQASEQVGLRD